jgi:hypothetical protein
MDRKLIIVDIKFGRKYTCHHWEDDHRLYFVPEYIKDSIVCGTHYGYRDGRHLCESDQWSKFLFGVKDKDLLYPMFKEVKNTALARKMYPNAEIEGEWLVVYG